MKTLEDTLQVAQDFSGGPVVKNPPVSAGDTGDPGSIPGLGRPPGEGNAILSSILAWESPWTEELGRLQSMRPKRVGRN